MHRTNPSQLKLYKPNNRNPFITKVKEDKMKQNKNSQQGSATKTFLTILGGLITLVGIVIKVFF